MPDSVDGLCSWLLPDSAEPSSWWSPELCAGSLCAESILGYRREAVVASLGIGRISWSLLAALLWDAPKLLCVSIMLVGGGRTESRRARR